jgi:hypothetical protein
MGVTYREDLDKEFKAGGMVGYNCMVAACRICKTDRLEIFYDGDGSLYAVCPKCKKQVAQYMVANRPTVPEGL